MRRNITVTNTTASGVCLNCLLAAFALFLNGFGVYLTMKAGIGAAPWDVFNLGLSNTFGILYGTASIIVSLVILVIDISMKEPIGLAMFIDSIVVGKSVDLFNCIDLIPSGASTFEGIIMLILGLFIIGYTQLLYMKASLGCGPRDTLLVGLKRRLKKVPIGAISIALLGTVTLIGYFLGGPVGIGTIICALFQGPIMELAFRTFKFDATSIKHANLLDSIAVLLAPFKQGHDGRRKHA
ncbi:MAG: hypothetical protein K6B75_00305 [Lachnospiraceae bacterium]|nr:hypothetical protein [Lachnospiraceae bacterium]